MARHGQAEVTLLTVILRIDVPVILITDSHTCQNLME